MSEMIQRMNYVYLQEAGEIKYQGSFTQVFVDIKILRGAEEHASTTEGRTRTTVLLSVAHRITSVTKHLSCVRV